MNHAVRAMELGYEVTPFIGKRPMLRDYLNRIVDKMMIEWYQRHGFTNYGIIARNLMVVDVDDPDEKTIAWLQYYRIEHSPMEVKTQRGYHAWFRIEAGQTEIKSRIKHLGLSVDLLTARAVTGPGSIVEGQVREGVLLPPEELPVFPVEAARVPERVIEATPVTKSVNAVRGYIRKIFAVSGSGGHNATFRAACKLVEAGFNFDEVLNELLVWNETNAVPAWSVEELQHKTRDALRKVRGSND